MDRPGFSVNRDRLAPRLAQLARLLDNPTPANVSLVQGELERLGRG
jgi:hypothetical protein